MIPLSSDQETAEAMLGMDTIIESSETALAAYVSMYKLKV